MFCLQTPPFIFHFHVLFAFFTYVTNFVVFRTYVNQFGSAQEDYNHDTVDRNDDNYNDDVNTDDDDDVVDDDNNDGAVLY